jgi:hypothetical protein
MSYIVSYPKGESLLTLDAKPTGIYEHIRDGHLARGAWCVVYGMWMFGVWCVMCEGKHTTCVNSSRSDTLRAVCVVCVCSLERQTHTHGLVAPPPAHEYTLVTYASTAFASKGPHSVTSIGYS